jgi:uncharacterized membrane protein YqhA
VLKQGLAASRFIIVFGVIGTLLASIALLVYGMLVVFDVVIATIREWSVSPEGAKHLSIEFIELVDLFLIGTVLYLIALGLYELFIDDTLPTPAWLHVETLDDLKSKLISVIVVLLGVSFLGSAMSWQGGKYILYFGIAIAAVLVPLAALQLFTTRGKAKNDSDSQPKP